MRFHSARAAEAFTLLFAPIIDFSAVLMIVFDNCWQKSKQKTMSAASASLKIGCTTLKRRNLSPFHSAFKQPAFLRFASPIFLTLSSRCGNQGIATQWFNNQLLLREITLEITGSRQSSLVVISEASRSTRYGRERCEDCYQ